MSFFNLFSKPDSSPHRGASITLRCANLQPSYYQNAAQTIKKMGLKGTMGMTKDGMIKVDVEGPSSAIGELLNLTESTLFGCPCESELVWKPLGNKFRTFVALPYVAAQPPSSDQKPPQR